MDIVTAAQFDKDLSKNLSGLPVRCGFEAEFASTVTQSNLTGVLAAFLDNKETNTWHSDSEGNERARLFRTGNIEGIHFSNDYGASHSSGYTNWSVEYDSSVPTEGRYMHKVEIVSPIMSLPEMTSAMQSVFAMIKAPSLRDKSIPLGKTGNETGLHLTFSIKDIDPDDIEPLKLALLLGEDHWGTVLGRSGSGWAKSTVSTLRSVLGGSLLKPDKARDFVDAYLSIQNQSSKVYTNLNDRFDKNAVEAARLLATRYSEVSSDKYRAINLSKRRKGIVEFRLPGGEGYEHKFDTLKIVAERFAYAFYASTHPEMYTEYYRLKLLKLVTRILEKINTAKDTYDISDATPYVRLVQGRPFLVFTEGAILDKIVAAAALVNLGDDQSYKFDYADESSPPSAITLRSRAGGQELKVKKFDGFTLYFPGVEQNDHAIETTLREYRLSKSVSISTGKVVHVVLGKSTNEMPMDTESEASLFNPKIYESLPAGIQAALGKQKDGVLDRLGFNPGAEFDPGDFDFGYLSQLIKWADSESRLALADYFKAALRAAYTDLSDSLIRTVAPTLLLNPLSRDPSDFRSSLTRTPEETTRYLMSDESRVRSSWLGGRSLITTRDVHSPDDYICRYFADTMLLSTFSGSEGSTFPMAQTDLFNSASSAYVLDVINGLPVADQEALISVISSKMNGYRVSSSSPALATVFGFINRLPDAEAAPEIEAPTKEAIQQYLTSISERRDASFYLGKIFVYQPQYRGQFKRTHPNATAIALDLAQRNIVLNILNGIPYTLDDDASPKLIRAVANFIVTRFNNNPSEGMSSAEAATIAHAAKLGVLDVRLSETVPEVQRNIQSEMYKALHLNSSPEIQAVGDSLMDVQPSLKTDTFKSLIGAKTNGKDYLGYKVVAGLISIGYRKHGVDALGMGSATFLLTVAQKTTPKWNVEQFDAFIDDLVHDCLGLPAGAVLPSCPLFDAAATLASKLEAESVGMFDGYVRSTTKKDGPEKQADSWAVKYPEIILELSEVAPIAYPDDFPQVARIEPAQLAALFGSPAVSGFDAVAVRSAYDVQSTFVHNINAYTVAQIEEFLSSPPIPSQDREFAATAGITMRKVANRISSNFLLAAYNKRSPSVLLALLSSVQEDDSLFSGMYSAASNSSRGHVSALLLMADEFKDQMAKSFKEKPPSFVPLLKIMSPSMSDEQFASKSVLSLLRFMDKNDVANFSAKNTAHVSGYVSLLMDMYMLRRMSGKNCALIDSLLLKANKSDLTVNVPASYPSYHK